MSIRVVKFAIGQVQTLSRKCRQGYFAERRMSLSLVIGARKLRESGSTWGHLNGKTD